MTLFLKPKPKQGGLTHGDNGFLNNGGRGPGDKGISRHTRVTTL